MPNHLKDRLGLEKRPDEAPSSGYSSFIYCIYRPCFWSHSTLGCCCCLIASPNLCIRLSILCLEYRFVHKLLWKSLTADKFITVKVWLRLKAVRLPHCRWGHTHTLALHQRLQLDLCNVTCCQDASSQLSRAEGICRERGGISVVSTDRPAEAALDLCLSNRAICVAPFLQGELLVCRGSCCANISCPVAPAAIVGLSPSLVVSHPASLCTSFVKQTKEDRHTIEGHFSFALALHWCPDTG